MAGAKERGCSVGPKTHLLLDTEGLGSTFGSSAALCRRESEPLTLWLKDATLVVLEVEAAADAAAAASAAIRPVPPLALPDLLPLLRTLFLIPDMVPTTEAAVVFRFWSSPKGQ